MSSAYRKRRSDESLDGDRKRILYDRSYDLYQIKQEYSYGGQANGSYYRENNCVAASESFNNYYGSRTMGGVQSAVVYNRANCNNSLNDTLLGEYDARRRINFQHEVYINSLRQCEPRAVNVNDLRRRLVDIDIRYLYDSDFSTALDLTVELESSLKYFVDTRNELVFLRKLQRHQCIPFNYNEINISDRSGMYDRMRFLENESTYRSKRMNALFHRLQRAVIPSIVDDIRSLHSNMYEKSWISRGRYWFSQFKQIKWEHGLKTGFAHSNRHGNYRRAYRRYNIKDEYDGERTSSAKIKSETKHHRTPSFDAKRVKSEQIKNSSKKSNTMPRKQESEKHLPPVSNIASKECDKKSSGLGKNVKAAPNKRMMSPPSDVVAAKGNNVHHAAESANDLSKSLILIEPNISLVSVPDDC